ncbi:Uncharacterised protein [Budvicia aquatica]|uniref:Uncharacterized protein n=2 Tax=Budvicia aquatica TaxID=82979 RepID=A0A484ZVX0_9GAMM|nr:Uncharacterised protein [Budvicia aquatica]
MMKSHTVIVVIIFRGNSGWQSAPEALLRFKGIVMSAHSSPKFVSRYAELAQVAAQKEKVGDWGGSVHVLGACRECS